MVVVVVVVRVRVLLGYERGLAPNAAERGTISAQRPPPERRHGIDSCWCRRAGSASAGRQGFLGRKFGDGGGGGAWTGGACKNGRWTGVRAAGREEGWEVQQRRASLASRELAELEKTGTSSPKEREGKRGNLRTIWGAGELQRRRGVSASEADDEWLEVGSVVPA